eukprot:6435883-Pyramimonas_sp.AAC.1
MQDKGTEEAVEEGWSLEDYQEPAGGRWRRMERGGRGRGVEVLNLAVVGARIGWGWGGLEVGAGGGGKEE